MATYAEIGSVCKKKDGGLMLKIQAEEITVKNYKGEVVTLKKGDYLQVDTVADETAKQAYLLENNIIAQDAYDKNMERVNATPDFVLAKLTAKS